MLFISLSEGTEKVKGFSFTPIGALAVA